jgi:hypothetical protein
VRDDGGVPVVGAGVRALVGRAPFADARTNADGSFQLANLTLGLTVIVHVTKVPYQDSDTQFVVAPSNTLSITLHVLQQATMSGIVQDVETGAPIPGARVRFQTNVPSANSGIETMAGPDGRYVFDHLYVQAGVRLDQFDEVVASADGFRDWVTPVSISGSTTMNVTLRKIQPPLIYTSTIGGPSDSWTCTITVTHPKLGTWVRPCQLFPISMRRAGRVSVSLTWQGSEEIELAIVSSTRPDQGLVGVSSYATGSRLLELKDVYIGGPGQGSSVRVLYDQSHTTVTAFRLTVDRAD